MGELLKLGESSAKGEGEKRRAVENNRPSVKTPDVALLVRFTRLEIHWDKRPSF